MSEENTTDILNLSNLSPSKGSRRPRKRLGIGEGSGHGKTCGKGQKGQKSRSGFGLLKGFEGGQMPLHRRLPKRGFVSRQRTQGKNIFKVVSLSRLAGLCGDSDSFTVESLYEQGILARAERIKILGGGKIEKKLKVQAHAISASAKTAIEAAGGEVSVIALPERPKGKPVKREKK